MKITYNNTTIDFFPEDLKEIMFSLSGGTDSASLLYLICTNFPKMKIRPYNMLDINHPFDTECARDVLSWFKTNFPKQQIEELELYPFDDLDPNYQEKAKKILNVNPGYYTAVRGVVKILKGREIHAQIRKKYPQLLKVTGMSKNPSFEDMKNYDNTILFNNREHRRDGIREQMQSGLYQPYLNVDKKFIADIFKKHNLMDDLFERTGSCVGSANVTNGFSEPCKDCWWCHEKRWAFGEF